MLQINKLKASVGKNQIITGLDMSVNAGETHAIMGPNGSGKSTLAQVIAGHPDYQIDEGNIFFKEKDLSELEPEIRSREGIFLGFQYPVEIPGVNNAYLLKAAVNAKRKHQGQEEINAVEFLKLAKEIMTKLEMKHEFLNRGINEGFSGGEKKRNEILQMALLEPSLAILDEISIRLASHIRDQIRKYSAEKNKITDQPYDEVIDRMINKLGREGRKNGAGFYEYPINGKKYLWPGLKNHFPRSKSNFLKKDIKDRLYFSQAIETLKCFEEGIIQSYEDANKGSLLGWGFPSKTGGIINFIKSYGMNNFMEQSNELAKKYGNRFNCPSIIKSMADL